MHSIKEAFLKEAKEGKLYIFKSISNDGSNIAIPFKFIEEHNNICTGIDFIQDKQIQINLEDLQGYIPDQDQEKQIKHTIKKCKELITRLNITYKHNLDELFYLNESTRIITMLLFFNFKIKAELYDKTNIETTRITFIDRMNAAVNKQIHDINKEIENNDNAESKDDLLCYIDILKNTPTEINTNYNTPYDLAMYAWPLILAPNPFGLS